MGEGCPKRLIVICSVAIVIGAYLRLPGLSEKVYWNDEAWTSLWLSGHSYAEIMESLCGRESSVQELRQYLHVTPNRGLAATIFSLAVDDPKQPPIYYGLLRLWADIAGDSFGTMRLLSVLIGLFAFPLTFILSRELFESRGTAWIGSALIASSPLHMLLSQEVRPYSLYTVMVLLSSWALLRSMRLKTKGSWRLYACTVIAGLYSHTLFLLVVFVHCSYVVLASREHGAVRLSWGSGTLARFRKAMLWAMLAFLPWVAVFAFGYRRGLGSMRWLLLPRPFEEHLEAWISGWGRVFVDVTELSQEPGPATGLSLALYSAVLCLIVFSFVFLWRTAPRRTRAFLPLLVLVPVVVLVTPDLVLGGQGSAQARYMVACYLGAGLAVAHLLSSGVRSRTAMWRGFATALLAVLLFSGIFSASLNARTDAPWTKSGSRHDRQIGRIVNEGERSVLACECVGVVRLLSLSTVLDADVSILLLRPSDRLVLPKEASAIFFFSITLGSRMVEQFDLEPLPSGGQLWRLKPRFGNVQGGE